MSSAAFDPTETGDLLAAVDWFGMNADPSAYIPRPATDAALDALERAAAQGRAPALLMGPSGMGKTLLLHVLASRLEDEMLPVYLPMPTLPQSELCALALGLLERPGGRHPEEHLLALAAEQRAAGRPLVLLLDDAGSMNPEAARGMASLAAVSHGGLRLVLAVTDGPEAYRIAEAVGPDLVAVPFKEPMTCSETRDYVRRRIARAGGLDAARRMGADLLARIHVESGGVPARVHLVSSLLLRAIRSLVTASDREPLRPSPGG